MTAPTPEQMRDLIANALHDFDYGPGSHLEVTPAVHEDYYARADYILDCGADAAPAPTGEEVARAIAGAIHADLTDDDVRTATADVMALYQGGIAAEVVRALWEAGADLG